MADVSVIKPATKKIIDRYMGPVFDVVSPAEALGRVAAEILNDRELNHFLLMHLPAKRGLKLGTMSYWDDIRVEVPWGLTVDFEDTPRRTLFFSYEFYSFDREYVKHSRRVSQTIGFPNHYIGIEGREPWGYDGVPTPGSLVSRLNEVLSSDDMRKHVIILPLDDLTADEIRGGVEPSEIVAG